jgi:hypothetical protein
MSKLYYLGIMSALILASAAPAQAQTTFKKVFGITSTTDYLNQLIVLDQMQNTLAEINDTNAKIKVEEKNVAAFDKLIGDELRKDIKLAEEQMAALAADVLRQSELRTKDLQSRIESRKGNIEELKKGLGAESKITKWAKTFNTVTLGTLGAAVNIAQKMDATSQQTLENQIAARRKSIADLDRQIAEEHKTMSSIFTSPAYQQKAQELNLRITEYKKALSNISNAAAKLRQERIFGPYNKKAEDLLKQLNTQIKEAKCTLIKTPGETKPAIINQCKQQKLDGAKKAMTTKFAACNSLRTSSTVAQINQCITEYRTNRR